MDNSIVSQVSIENSRTPTPSTSTSPIMRAITSPAGVLSSRAIGQAMTPRHASARILARIRANIRADAWRGVMAWPMARLDSTPAGEVMARIIGDVEVLGVGVREFSIETWDTILFSLSLMVAMLVYDPILTM